MKLKSILLEVQKDTFRTSLQHLLSKPNTSIFSNEVLLNTKKSAFEYTTRNSNPKTYSVDVEKYKSGNGYRYLVLDDGDVIAAAYVNEDNTLTGIITAIGFENVGIGGNLIRAVKLDIPNLKMDELQSKQGSRLINKL